MEEGNIEEGNIEEGNIEEGNIEEGNIEEGERFWKEEKEKQSIKNPIKKNKTSKPKGKIKVNLEGEKIRNGLGQLVLTVIELLRELMEKQAIRRIEKGKLTDEQIERLGNNFKRLKDEVERFKDFFELEDEDIGLDLGPVTLIEDETGKASVVEILDRLLGKGVVVRGDVVISVADVDLIALNLGLLLASIDKASELYGTSTKRLQEEVRKLQEENENLKNSQSFVSNEASRNDKLRKRKR
jgi:hypothetical protein